MKINHLQDTSNLCNGCAAKIAADPLKMALKYVGKDKYDIEVEDAHPIKESEYDGWLQSVDGFPALVSDPWQNARITTLHACSDLWACGASVISAQAVVTLPATSPAIQTYLLSQVISGVNSALKDQNASLLGGHTLESRSAPSVNLSNDLQVILSINGYSTHKYWKKNGLKPGDYLLLSRPLGTGVVFAAWMQGEDCSSEMMLA